MKWIKTDEELPPCDGYYEVCNRPNDELHCDAEYAFYNGHVFLSDSVYKFPDYWRELPRRDKKYGKILK